MREQPPGTGPGLSPESSVQGWPGGSRWGLQ